MAFRTVIEPQDSRVAFAMPDEVEVTTRQQVCDCFRDRSQERLDCLFTVDTSHLNIPSVVGHKRGMTGPCARNLLSATARFFPGLSIGAKMTRRRQLRTLEDFVVAPQRLSITRKLRDYWMIEPQLPEPYRLSTCVASSNRPLLWRLMRI